MLTKGRSEVFSSTGDFHGLKVLKHLAEPFSEALHIVYKPLNQFSFLQAMADAFIFNPLSLHYFFNFNCTSFEFGCHSVRINGRIGQPVGACLSEMECHPHHVVRDFIRDTGFEGNGTAP